MKELWNSIHPRSQVAILSACAVSTPGLHDESQGALRCAQPSWPSLYRNGVSKHTVWTSRLTGI